MNNQSNNEIRVLLIEHQTLVRIGIKTILEAEKDMKVVAEAETGAKGFELFRELKPDVTILSLRTPDSCAIDSLSDYFAENKKAKIIVLADTTGDVEITKALKKGALGYICRNVSPDELVKAIRAVSAGRKFIPTYIANVLSENIGREELTNSEQRILQMIVGGMSNKEIAFALDISENTVKTHNKNIFDKIGVSDRTSAATTAIRRGLVRVDI
ncbi:MAG: response regulator transcription factor [Pyrinomonadaceae bacterium]